MNKKLQVFVSSTYSDLKNERQACVQAILTAGHIPAGMELFSAGNESQLEVIKRWIEDSDVYMLLLGARYGSIEPKSGLSYTELEYIYALEIGKPVFSLIMNEDLINQKVNKDGKEVLELENPQKYKDFRSLVLSKISKFFNNEDQLQLAVIQSLIDIQSRYTLTGWIRTNEAVDSVRALNQISQLTLINKQLEYELTALRNEINYDQKSTIAETLSVEAKTLIIAASKWEKGEIYKYKRGGKYVLKIDEISYPKSENARSLSIWEDSFKELVKCGLINQISENSIWQTYSVSRLGYEVADQLNA